MDSIAAPTLRDVDLNERRHTFELFAKGMLLFAAHVLVILAILGLIFVW
jgi:hypothetical protein